MRRWYPAAVRSTTIMVTPDIVQIHGGSRAQTFVQNIHIGRTFNMEASRTAASRASAPRCRAGTARRSASGTATC